MAGDIKIRMVSEIDGKGFRQAVQGMKEVETAYEALTKKTLSNSKGNINKMVKNYKAILDTGNDGAKEMAGKYFQNWANALIYNFSGGDASKLKAILQKAISEITNVAGEDNLAYINMTQLNRNVNKMAKVLDENASGVESASRRKQAVYEREYAVLMQLDMKEEAYNLTMQKTKAEMMALSPSMRNYSSKMEKLSEQYKEAQKNLEELTAEQSRATKGGLGQYVGTVVKGMLVHQMVAKALGAVKQGLRESVQVAGEAEQKFNKLNTVFEGFTESANIMAKQLASSIGVANSTSASALSTVGDLLQAQGMGISDSLEKASDWVKRFQDIINFKDINESLDEFSKNMMAGFLGNTRNLRSVGAVIKESAVKAELLKRNLDQLTGSELELAKMNIRAEMTFKQLDNAMGATEREWDTNLAVNRRLNEAQKQFKETLGDTINSVLKPMKSAWTDVLTQINKANLAQKEFNKGKKEIKVYDIRENEDDMNTFRKSLNLALNSYSTGMMFAGRTVDGVEMANAQELEDTLIKTLNADMIMFNASLVEVERIIGDSLTPSMKTALALLEDKNNAEIKRNKDIESRRATLNSAGDSFDKFQEALLAVTGVNFEATNTKSLMNNTFSDDATNTVLDMLAGYTAENVSNAIESIAKEDLSTWGDVINGELKGLDIPELFEKKMESVAQLFTLIWNEYMKDGVITDEERTNLQKTKDLYADLNKQLEEHNRQLEAQKAYNNALSTVTSARAVNERADYEKTLVGTDAEKEYSLEMWDINRTIGAFILGLTEVGVSFVDAGKLADQYRTELEKTALVTKEAKEAEERRTQLAEITDKRDGYLTEIANLGKSSAEIERDKLTEDARKAMIAGDYELLGVITEEIMAFDDLQRKTKELAEAEEKAKAQTELTDKINPFLSIISAYKQGSTALGDTFLGSVGGGIIGILSDILAQTEAFSEVSNIISTYIVPVFNKLLAPMLPMIESISRAIGVLIDALFVPVIVPALSSAIIALDIISRVIMTISAVVRTIYYAITFQWGKIDDVWSEWIEDQKNQAEASANALEALTDIATGIYHNTQGNDELLRAYTQMRDAQMITATEFDALVANLNGIKYDRVRSYKGGSWSNGSGGTTIIYTGDFKFTIEGTNLSAEEIAVAVTRQYERWASSGQFY